MTLNGQWDAAAFFESLTAKNYLAQSENFAFCRVSGLDGFEEAVAQMQSVSAFVCVSDIADGYTELNNTPRTRRVKTVFLAMRHAAEDMEARSECMEIMRELFRQFMSRLLLEKVRLEQNCIYIDPRITFNEIDRYFFNGAAGAYFQIAVDCYTDLRLDENEWNDYFYDIWLLKYDKVNGVKTIALVRKLPGTLFTGLSDARKAIESTIVAPVLICSKISKAQLEDAMNSLDEVKASYYFCEHGQKPAGT